MTYRELMDRLADPAALLPTSLRAEFDDQILDFERTWGPDSLDDRLARITELPRPLGHALTIELVSIDVERRSVAGQDWEVDAYLSRFPELRQDEELMTALLIAHCRALMSTGQQVDWQQLQKDYPDVSYGLYESLIETRDEKAMRVGTAGEGGDSTIKDDPIGEESLHGEFDRYRIDRELGRGGMGIVYLAYDKKLERPVAIKTPVGGMRPDEQADFVSRLYEEARVAAKLGQHPHICSVHDVGEFDSTHFISMEYVEGKTLARRLAVEGKLPESTAIELTEVLAQTLEFAHRKGVIHRDLKPANVMINEHGKPVLTDFGLAQRAGPGTPETGRVVAVAGTPAYMAPEQLDGTAVTGNEATDIYSLGVIFTEMLTGRRPPHGSTATLMGQAEENVCGIEPTGGTGLRREVESMRRRMVSICPEERFDSMAEIAEACRDILDRRPFPANLFAHRFRAGPTQIRTFIPVSFCFVMLMTIVISFVTNYGEVRFRLANRDVEILVDGDQILIGKSDQGERLKAGPHDLSVLVAGTKIPLGQSFTLHSGEYDGDYRAVLQLDGATVTSSRFEVLRGETHLLSIALIPSDASQSPGSNGSGSQPSQVDSRPSEAPGGVNGLAQERAFMAGTDISKGGADDSTGYHLAANVRSPLDELERRNIGDREAYLAGLGVPERVPKSIVAIYGDGRWMHWNRLHRNSIAFGPQGERLATGSYDGTVVEWDVVSGIPRRVFASPGGGVMALDWHHRRADFILVGTSDGQIFDLSLKDGRWRPWDRLRHEDEVIDSIAISRDASFFAVGGTNRVHWGAFDDKNEFTSVAHRNVRSVAISPDGRTVASVGGDSVVRLWDRESATVKNLYKGERRELYNTVDFSPDSSRVVVGLCNSGKNFRGLIRLLDHDGDVWSRVLASPGGFAWSARYSPDGRWLAEGRESGFVHFWDTKNWEMKRSLATTNYPTMEENGKRSIDFSRDGKRFASAGVDNAIHLWETESGNPIGRPLFGRMLAVACNGKASRVAAGGDKGTYQIWSLPDGRSTPPVSAHEGPLRSLLFTADDSVLATGGDDGQVKFWNSVSGKPRRDTLSLVREGTQRPVMALAGHPHEPIVGALRIDGEVSVWNFRSGAELFSVPSSHLKLGLSLAISPSGELMAVGGMTSGKEGTAGLVLIVSMSTGKVVRSMPVEFAVRSVAFSPAGDRIALVSTPHALVDGAITPSESTCSVRVFGSTSGAMQAYFPMPATDVDFAPDGRRLVVGGWDGKARIVDLAKATHRVLSVGPSGGVISDVLMGPHGRHVLTANRNGSVYVLRIGQP